MTLAPSASMWSRCCSTPRRSPPNHSNGVSGPRPVGSAVPLARNRPLRTLDVEPARGEAVGKDLVDDGLRVPRGRAAVDRVDEVVRIGNVVPDESSPVQPGVADLAAGQQPAIRNDRALNREAGDPPVVAVPLRLDAARFAVADVTKHDRVDVEWHVHARDHVLPELGRGLEQVHLGSVVTRLVEQRRSGELRDSSSLDRPLREPADDVALQEDEEQHDRY